MKDASTEVIDAALNEAPSIPSEEAHGASSSAPLKATFEEPLEKSLQKQKVRLLSLVRVNAIADYYRVTKLRERANCEIKDVLQNQWSATSFIEAARAVASDTGDKELHHIFAQIAAKHVEELFGHGFDLSGLTSLDDFAMQFMKGSAARVTELTALAKVNEMLFFELEKVKVNINKCSTAMKKKVKCRRCRALFHCYFETSNYATYEICCKKCNTRVNA